MSQREDLLEGAKKCLVEKGYSRTTARDIAAASGAHLASIGYHFGSKDNLMNTAVLEAASEWGDTFEAAVRTAEARNPHDRARALFEALFGTIPDRRPMLLASVQAVAQAQFDPDIRERLDAGYAQARLSMAAIVLGVPEEEVDEHAAASLGSVVYSLVSGYVLQAVIDPGSLPTVDQALAGLRTLAPEPGGN
ncbi:TetR/AcrR family transcriptional regulator [Nocardiopsis sp. EMB25]|uniref:TetR/AcrR family transcriptional regulator n=1 Tax=Nocardiopsis sp. EMB25 TaxID=2835867 RepID=UPI00228348FF|nr:TetR/AcrR family transcriptional regulator [Nocardiopsis sp. EMB25]MCY9785689.1 TetR/AcrR family transcriptional regulator [Nocardiopsis sp. EMB25]